MALQRTRPRADGLTRPAIRRIFSPLNRLPCAGKSGTSITYTLRAKQHSLQLVDQRFLPGFLHVQEVLGMSAEVLFLFWAQILARQDKDGQVGRTRIRSPFPKQLKATHLREQ